MPLQERLMEDLKEALRQQDKRRVSTIRLLRAAIQNEEIARREPLEEGDLLNVVARQVRQRQESIAEFKRGNRPDLVEQEEAELAILRTYLPQQLTLEELSDLARRAIAEVAARGPQDKGKVMGRLMPQVKGKAEGALVNRVVTQLLGG
ncbi:MAG: GatB/YqeY domain-containing protein [Chloroflexi bacterium]|nr:GatB/YqeY domain-containing protein [Chloroflexota bacterium]